MFKKYNFFIFVLLVVNVVTVNAMPPKSMEQYAFQIDGMEDVTPDEQQWSAFEREHEDVLDEGFKHGVNEGTNNQLENFDGSIDDIMASVGLNEVDDVEGVWPFCSRCRLFLPSYMFFLKARCVMSYVQFKIGEDDSEGWAEIGEKLDEARKFIDKGREYREFCIRQKRNFDFNEDDLILYLADRQCNLLQRQIDSKRQTGKMSTLELDQERVSKIKPHSYERKYYDSFRMLMPQDFLKAKEKLADDMRKTHDQRERRPKKK
ncbi:hypothetical protein [Endozoicomonas sp. Mp262]|uniref:hypothetical protein n=1 Tax=Endozoicomonas sp. Mp262 TaxID=2919499 RepID=UPI0021DA851D